METPGAVDPLPLPSPLDTVRKVYAFWGNHPLLYAASDYVTFLFRPRLIRGRAVDALGLRPGSRVLEMGCGTGRNLALLERSAGKGGRVVAFDYSRDMLRAALTLCRGNGWQNVVLVRGDAAELGVRENSLDGVLSVLAVSAIPGWRRALEHCHRALRPGGVLSVCDARLFSGAPGLLNPLVEAVYRRYAAWDPHRNIPEAMRTVFGNVAVRSYNLGTFFVAKSVKRETQPAVAWSGHEANGRHTRFSWAPPK